MREHVGRGVSTGSRTNRPSRDDWGDFVRGDAPRVVPPEELSHASRLCFCAASRRRHCVCHARYAPARNCRAGPSPRHDRTAGHRCRQRDADPHAGQPDCQLGHRHHRRRYRARAAAHRAGRLAHGAGAERLQTGGPGGQTSVFMRGTNSNHVKVFIDGIDAGDPSSPNGAFDFAHLLTGDIERIEVLRGPQSGLYGSDAIGGVISITTKSGEGPPKVTALVEGGSFGTFNQNAGVSGSQGNFDYAFNVLHYRSTNIPVTPLNLLAPGVRRNNDSYNNWTYSANLGAKVTDDLSVWLIGRYTQAKVGFTGDDFLNFVPPAPEALQDTQVNHNAYTRAEAVWLPFDGSFKNVFGVSYTNLWNRSIDPNADSFFTTPLVSPPTTNLGQRTKFDWRGEAKVAPGQTVVLGLEHQKESLAHRFDRHGRSVLQFHADHDHGENRQQRRLRRAPVGIRQALLPRVEHPSRRQRDVRRTHDVAPGSGRARSRDRDQAEGELRHRVQGADADGIVRQQSVVRHCRQSQSDAGDQQGLRCRLRAVAAEQAVQLRRHLLQQRDQGSDRRDLRSGDLHLVLHQRGIGEDARRRNRSRPSSSTSSSGFVATTPPPSPAMR